MSMRLNQEQIEVEIVKPFPTKRSEKRRVKKKKKERKTWLQVTRMNMLGPPRM